MLRANARLELKILFSRRHAALEVLTDQTGKWRYFF